MKKHNNTSRAGLEEQYSPRTAGQKHLHTNTDLCVDLKTILLRDSIAKLGKDYLGVLKHDEEYHYTFNETTTPMVYKRNPRVYDGRYITITRRKDGSLKLNFKALRMDAGFSPERYAFGVYQELREALKSLGGKR